jgi:hypothetical protein
MLAFRLSLACVLSTVLLGIVVVNAIDDLRTLTPRAVARRLDGL